MAQAAPVQPVPYQKRDALLTLLAIIAVSVTLNAVILPFAQVVDPVSRSFGINDLQFSLLIGAFYAVPSTVMAVAGGWLADRFSRRRLLLCAISAWTAGAIWTALAASYGQLAIARMVVAAAAGITFPVAMTWVNDAFPPERRAKAIGALFIVLNIGPGISSALGGTALGATSSGLFASIPLIGQLAPWRSALLLLALTNVISLVWVALLRDAPRAPQEPVRALNPAHPDDAAFPMFLVAALIAGAALLALSDSANLAWLPTVLKRQYGFDAEQVGFTFALITMAAGILGPLLAGFLDDRVHSRHGIFGSVITCAIACAICAPLLSSFAGTSAHLLVTALLASGIFSVMAMTVGYVAIQSLLSSRRRGTGTGIAHAMTNLTTAFAPTVVAGVSGGISRGPATLGTGVAIVTVLAFLSAAALYSGVAWKLRGSRPTAH
ncbi:MFS transporter [Rhodanobacter sp. UC4436_H3]